MAQIDKPNTQFNPVIFTGNGSTQSITGVNFQPDLIWIKQRNAVQNNRLIDSIRGNTKEIYSDLTNAEDTLANGITSFDSDGFSLGSSGGYNQNAGTYVTWNWLGGGTAVSNTAGSITSSVSANTTAGFSIVSYTGTGSLATVGHGLTSAPSMIIVKKRTVVEDWMVYHKSLGATNYIKLNLIDGTFASSAIWNNTAPDSDKFYLGSSGDANASGQTSVAYCFAEVKGFSKFGSYTGNGSTDGSFVYTGFSPAFVMIKNVGTSNWTMHDNKRNPYNQVTDRLYANLSNAEDVGGPYGVDFLSNGMKMRTTESTSWNGNGVTFIYMAFAEQPFVTSTKTPTTAR